MEHIRLIIGINGMRSGRVWLDDFEITQAYPENIIRRSDTPLSLFLAQDHTLLTEVEDFQVEDADSLANEEFVGTPLFRVMQGGKLKHGDAVMLNWGCGVKFQQHREAVCFSLHEPLQEYAERLRTVKQYLHPDGMNIHINEVSYAGYDSLCRSSGKFPAQLVGEYCGSMYDSIQAVMPGAKVRIYGDPFDIYVHDVRAFPVDYRPWTAGENGHSSLSYLPRAIQVMAMASYSWNLDSTFSEYHRLGFKGVVALMLDKGTANFEKYMLSGRDHENCIGLQAYGWFVESFDALPEISFLAWKMSPCLLAYPPEQNDSSVIFRTDAWCNSLSGEQAASIESVFLQYQTPAESSWREQPMINCGADKYTCSLLLNEPFSADLNYRIIATDNRGLTASSPPGELEPYSIAFRDR
jgi:hypothetical protein